jgi:hypothetical protein
MKTYKVATDSLREKVMNALKLDYKIENNKMVYRGDLKGYKTLVDLLVNERIKLGISPY